MADKDGLVVVAIIPNRGGEVGVAKLIESGAELQLCQVIDTSHAYRFVVSEILSDAPDIIILLDTSHPGAALANQAVQDACQVDSDCRLRRVGRSAFDDTVGTELIQKYCTAADANIEAMCTSNYLAVGCAGATRSITLVCVTARIVWSVLHPQYSTTAYVSTAHGLYPPHAHNSKLGQHSASAATCRCYLTNGLRRQFGRRRAVHG